MEQIDDSFNGNETMILVGWGLNEEEANEAQDLLQVTKQSLTFHWKYTDFDESNFRVYFIVKTQLNNCRDTTHFSNTCKYDYTFLNITTCHERTFFL